MDRVHGEMEGGKPVTVRIEQRERKAQRPLVTMHIRRYICEINMSSHLKISKLERGGEGICHQARYM